MNKEQLHLAQHENHLQNITNLYMYNDSDLDEKDIELILDTCINLTSFSFRHEKQILLADKFEKLTNLEELKINAESAHQIQFPSSTAQLKNLKEIHITLPQITLPKQVKWGQLKYLYLYSINDIENLEVITQCTNITHLVIDAPIKEINFLHQLENLESLSISSSELTHLSLAKCHQLFDLHIHDSEQLSTLTHLSEATHLHSLNLDKNKISTPLDFSNLSYLQKLTLTSCAFDLLDLAGCHQLQHLCLYNCHHIKKIENLTDATNLELIRLYTTGLTETPSFKGLDKIRDITFTSNDTSFPTEIFESTHLQEANFSQFNNTTLAIQSNSIRRLYIHHFSQLQDLSFLTNLPQLALFSLQNCTQINDISLLTKIKNIRTLYLQQLDLNEFPIFTHALDYCTIKQVNTPESDFKTLMNLKAKQAEVNGLRTHHHKEYSKLVYALSKAPITLDDQHFFHDHFSPSILDRRRKRDTIEFSKTELLKLNLINYKPILEESTQLIHQQIEEDLAQNPLGNEMKISVLGTIGTKKTVLKERLKELNITFHPKIKADTTHVIIGKKVKDFEAVNHLTWVAEQHLTDFLNELDTPYLLETEDESEESVENIRSLLLADDGSALLGLEFLESGGVHKSLFVELLFVNKVSENKKVKDQSKKILLANTGAEYKKVLADRSRFIGSKGEKDIAKQLISMHKKYPTIDWCLFSFYFFKRFQKGARFLLDYSTQEHHAIRKQLFDYCVQGGVLNHQRIFSKEPYTPTFDASYMYQYYKARKLPLEIFEYNLVELNLRCTFTKELPIEIEKLKNLKKLDCAYNMLQELPYEISELENLEELYLEENEFKSFPMVIKKLKNLKKLSFFRNRKKHDYFEIEIPQEIKNELPNCEFITQ